MQPIISPQKNNRSSADVVQEMLENILANRTMGVQQKMDQLHELSLEHTFFHSPGQAVQIISVLAGIIGSDPDPSIRAKGLQVMEQMIASEERAEAKSNKPPIDWSAVNVMLHDAQQHIGLDKRDAVRSLGQTNTILPPEQSAVLLPQPQSSVGAKALEPSAQALPAQRLAAANNPSMPETTAVRPQAHNAQSLALQQNTEPTILKFLQSIAVTDDEENIRALADRILTKIQALKASTPSSSAAPTYTEG